MPAQFSSLLQHDARIAGLISVLQKSASASDQFLSVSDEIVGRLVSRGLHNRVEARERNHQESRSPERSLLLRLPILLQKPLNKSRINLPRPEVRIRENLAVQRDRRVHALDNKHLQRPRHPR